MTNSRPSATTMRVNLGLNYSDQNFSGTLDEFVVFNKLLTDTQMSDLADLALNGRTP